MNNSATRVPRGRPRRFAQLENLRDNPPPNCGKRPHYINGIGLLHGSRGITAYIKIRLPNSSSKEIKLGSLDSFSWDQLEAARVLRQGRADRGEDIEERKPVSFVDQAEDWLTRKKQTARGYGTLKGHVKKHLLPAFGRKLLKDITVTDVDRWSSEQLGSGLKPATVNRQISTLNSILNDAVKGGILSINPARLAERAKGATARQVFLSEGQIAHVLAIAETIEREDNANAELMPFQKRGWLKDFVLWALHSGMRRQEILNLRFSDVVVTSEHAIVIVRTSKSGNSRAIPATLEMGYIVERMRVLHRENGDDRLFPVSLTTVKRKLRALWRRTGLGDVRLHDLRRTNATMLVKAGMDMRTVAGRLGHSNTNSLMSTYAVYDPTGTNILNATFSKLS